MRNSKKIDEEEILGEEFDGTIVSDFLRSFIPLGYKKQKCWVHLIRHTKKLTKDYHGRKESHNLHKAVKKVLEDALNFIEKNPPPDKTGKMKKQFEKRIRGIGYRYREVKFCEKVSKLLIEYANELFTFFEENVDWHNNAAERAIRPDVVRRKISGGNRSEQGAKDYSVIASVMDTCKLRGENFSDLVLETANNSTAFS